MFCDRKISGFANVNRVIARVCGDGTLANMPRLCEALPEAKRITDGQIGKFLRAVREFFGCLLSIIRAKYPRLYLIYEYNCGLNVM